MILTTIRPFPHAGWMRCRVPDPHTFGPCPSCTPWPGGSRSLHTPQPALPEMSDLVLGWPSIVHTTEETHA